MLIATVIIMAVPAGAAFALPNDQGQEQMIKQEVIVGYFDIWKGSDFYDIIIPERDDAFGRV